MRRIFGIFLMANVLDFISTIAFLSTGAAVEGNPILVLISIDTPIGAIVKLLIAPLLVILLILAVERRSHTKFPSTGLGIMSGFMLAIAFMNFNIAYTLSPHSSLALAMGIAVPFVVASCV